MPEGRAPAGTVTFLFTDIEGSTRLWEASPNEMRSALARHDALVREAIVGADGHVFKTVGDAFCAAFHSASDGLSAALAAQAALGSEPWPDEIRIKVRMALHTGAVESRDEDYFGQPLNRVARLLATGHGGQVLLSDVTHDLCRDNLPANTSLKSLGEHRLKDLSSPEGIFQLCCPVLTADFPPLRSLQANERADNLPQQVTSFVGRGRELLEVRTLLEKCRLVTLIGSGGCGKTRLALEVAAEMLQESPGGVWLVELASLTDPNLVASEVSAVLNVNEQPGRPALQTLTEHLKDKHLLLVLDNCEHLLDGCAPLAEALIRHCPKVTVMATSRESLGINGEQTYRLPSLSSPDPKRDATADSVTQFESALLFVERVKLHQPSFVLTDADAPALASICHRLDGIPLALELAAARVRSLSLLEIDRRLDQRFRLLTGGSRTSVPRQQTLRSLMDWSYDLLKDAEKALLCRLSVFSGGWTLESAEQVCAGEPVEEWEVLDFLTSLVDKNLVVAEPQQGSTRYRLLETIRQYALDRLLERGEGGHWRDRHLAHFLALGQAVGQILLATDDPGAIANLQTENENLRVALDWSSAGDGSRELGLRLAASLWRFWRASGNFREGRAWLDLLLAAEGLAARTATRADALAGAGVFAWRQGDYSTAHGLHEESLSIWRELGDRSGEARSLRFLGLVTWQLGDHPKAVALHEESLAVSRQSGDRQGIAEALNILGTAAHEQGDYRSAQTLHEESLAIAKELGDPRGIVMSLLDLGSAALEQGEYAMARIQYRESLKILIGQGDRLRIAQALEGCAQLAATLKSYVQAARAWGTAERLREEIAAPHLTHERVRYDRYVAATRETMGEAPFLAAWQDGRSMHLTHAIELALAEPAAEG